MLFSFTNSALISILVYYNKYGKIVSYLELVKTKYKLERFRCLVIYKFCLLLWIFMDYHYNYCY